jgi:uncharacterized protein (TIGR00255 family)
MTLSMTGFGKAQFTSKEKSISIEIKCLNSKQQDVFVKLPSVFKSKELEVRNLLIEKLIRGKIEFFLYTDNGSQQSANKINTTLVQTYFDQVKPLLKTDELTPELLATILRMPDIFSSEKEELDEEEWNKVLVAIKEAIEQVIVFRAKEGDNLKQDLLLRIGNISKGLATIMEKDVARIQKTKDKLAKAVSEIKENLLDKNRFEQELIYYLEKLDITEEKVRLKSHCDYFLESLETAEDKGKKLGFVSQEIGREINTIGSKVNDSEMQKIVVSMKDELEKIKEQLLNIL